MTTRPRILIVDDVPDNVYVLGRILSVEYDIQFAISGREALALVAQRCPSLILLDVMMPEMDGIQVLRYLRDQEHSRDIPVILVSADASEQTQLDGLDVGAEDYLIKPIATSVLLARVRNLLTRKNAENRLRLASQVFQHSGEAIMVTDSENRIVEVNPAFTRLTGYSLEEVMGRDPKLLSSGRTSLDEYRAMWADILRNGVWQGEIWDRRKDGKVYPKLLTISLVRSQEGVAENYIAMFTDISERKAAEARIAHLAHHDSLTGLANRMMLKFTLEHVLIKPFRRCNSLALLFVDLDHFKQINDSLGHPVGDQLLQEVAKRLTTGVREGDMVARLGGDEFVILLYDADAQLAGRISTNLLHKIGQTYEIGNHRLHISGSIGICLCPEDGDSYEELMKHADLALYDAKDKGRNNFSFFRRELNQASQMRRKIESHLYLAFEQKQLSLHYQPQFSVDGGEIVVVEALLRWHDPELGWVSPDKFIPIAEETGLILRIGQWVLEEACRQLRAWKDAGWTDLRVAVNLSPYQFRQEGLSQQVADTLAQYGLSGTDLELELTESAAMKNPEVAIKILQTLCNQGVSLAVDDFGTGYSSLSYLKLLPIHCLKLDKSFVCNIEEDINDAAICSAIIAMAHALGLQVVAEGVETEAQRQYLEGLGCDLMQGYLLGRPVAADALFAAVADQAVAGLRY